MMGWVGIAANLDSLMLPVHPTTTRPGWPGSIGLIDHDGAVEECADGGGVGAEVFGHFAYRVDRSAISQGQREKDLVGRVGIDRASWNGLECEQLVHGVIGDRLGRLAALSQADERGGDGLFVLGDQADGGTLAWAGPAYGFDFDDPRSSLRRPGARGLGHAAAGRSRRKGCTRPQGLGFA